LDGWIRLRRQRLIARARAPFASARTIGSMGSRTLRDVNDILKYMLGHDERHRLQPALMARRLDADAPPAGADSCPERRSHDVEHPVLVLEEQSEDIDLLPCPCCQVPEFVVHP